MSATGPVLTRPWIGRGLSGHGLALSLVGLTLLWMLSAGLWWLCFWLGLLDQLGTPAGPLLDLPQVGL
jgi:hypothetical protein